MPITIATLRSYREHGYGLVALCTNYGVCSHSGPVSIDALIQRLGRAFDAVQGRRRIAALLYCSICGKYHPVTQLHFGQDAKASTDIRTHPRLDPLPMDEATRRHIELQRMIAERDGERYERTWTSRVRKFGPGK